MLQKEGDHSHPEDDYDGLQDAPDYVAGQLERLIPWSSGPFYLVRYQVSGVRLVYTLFMKPPRCLEMRSIPADVGLPVAVGKNTTGSCLVR